VAGDLIHPDEQFIADLHEGGEPGRAAFALMYRHCLPVLRAALLRMGASLSPQDREDLIQQVFMEFWRNRSNLRGECSVAHYLRRIAACLLSNHCRNEARRKRREADTVTVWAEDDDHIQRHEALELVRHAMKQLSDVQRQAVELVCLQGRSVAEAAEIACCSAENMKSRCRRGKLLIKKQLQGLA
jgi:RNA polymerase sigma-70 factor (ECF subfamily)